MTNRSILILALVLVLVAFYALLVLKPRQQLRYSPSPAPPNEEATSYAEIEGYFKDFKNRGLAQLQPIGKSVLGKAIYALYPRSAGTEADGKRVLIVAGQHGVEPLPVDAVMQMVDRGVFQRWHIKTAVIAVANPDGLPYFYRYNWNNEDLNRNWPHPSQPETIAISDYIRKLDPDVVIDLHEGQPYHVEMASSTNPASLLLAKAGVKKTKAEGFDVALLPNSAGPGSGLLHRVMGMQGRVGLMLESPVEIDPVYREPVYAAFVSGVLEAMEGARWRR